VRVAASIEPFGFKNAHLLNESMDVTLSPRIPWLMCCYF
jgi:hypothetical protein